MNFVYRALNSVTKCELTQNALCFPHGLLRQASWGTATLQLPNWALVLQEGTLYVPALKTFWRPNPESECSAVSVSHGFKRER